MIRSQSSLIVVVLVAVVSMSVAMAKKNDPVIDLKYVPQQTIAATEVALGKAVRTRPVTIALTDGRTAEDPAFLGIRTDDDDRQFDLTSRGEVLPFVDQVVRDIVRDWGIAVEEVSDLVLTMDLLRFHVSEKNQAVGALYKANVQLNLQLHDRQGTALWSGTASGDATRYGKKFNNTNCNEVLSDALLEAVADGLNSPALQRAWAGQAQPTQAASATAGQQEPAAKPTATPISPARLLEEVKALRDKDLDTAIIVDFVKGKTLTQALSADDLVKWKDAGIRDEVIRAAVNCPVHKG